jgi:uncharacterized protein
MSGSQLQINFKGDWGMFNLSRICGWMAWQVGTRTGAQEHLIHTGRGMADNIIALHRREVDVAVATPAGFALMAQEGRGPHAGEPMPELRAIANVPHEDALLFAVSAEHGVKTMAELRERKPKLRLTTSPNDGGSYVGFGAAETLRASGIEPEDIVTWGGEYLWGENPMECLAQMLDGSADAVMFEAMMIPPWKEVADKYDLNFLSLEEDAAARIESEFLLGTQAVPAGYLRGMDEGVQGVDFGGWLVLTREDVDEEVTELLARSLAETSDFFESQYTHIPVRFSPLAYPITPQKLADVPIELHPGAARYFDSIGVGPTAAD